LHWHARDYEGRERADDVTLYREVIEGIREQTDDALLHPTLGFIATQGDAQGRVRHILELNQEPKTRIDMVPVDFGSFGADLWDERAGLFLTDDQFVVNRVAYLKELLSVLKENGLYVYSVVWSAGAVRTARSLQKMGLLGRTTFWCLGFTGEEVPGGPPPTPANLSTFLEAIPPGDPWTVHCRNGDALPLAAWAITQGGHVSIGLGDYPYSRFGKPRKQRPGRDGGRHGADARTPGGHAGPGARDPARRPTRGDGEFGRSHPRRSSTRLASARARTPRGRHPCAATTGEEYPCATHASIAAAADSYVGPGQPGRRHGRQRFYVIGHINVKDAEKWAEYRGKVPVTLSEWGAEVVLRGKRTEVLTGDHGYTDTVVIRFPEASAIGNWYRSPAYQALIPLREQAAEMVLIGYQES
jgi:uncharacterized protein (DUF1330 family)/uncharacterized protein (DUF849 family)